MKTEEKQALETRARAVAEAMDGVPDGAWEWMAWFAAAEVDRERRRVRRAKNKKARRRQ